MEVYFDIWVWHDDDLHNLDGIVSCVVNRRSHDAVGSEVLQISLKDSLHNGGRVSRDQSDIFVGGSCRNTVGGCSNIPEYCVHKCDLRVRQQIIDNYSSILCH